jgi:hypothetical protein
VTLAEFGLFRTAVFASASAQGDIYTNPTYEDMPNAGSNVLRDPAKAAEAIWYLIRLEKPPLRLALVKDAIRGVKNYLRGIEMGLTHMRCGRKRSLLLIELSITSYPMYKRGLQPTCHLCIQFLPTFALPVIPANAEIYIMSTFAQRHPLSTIFLLQVPVELLTDIFRRGIGQNACPSMNTFHPKAQALRGRDGLFIVRTR